MLEMYLPKALTVPSDNTEAQMINNLVACDFSDRSVIGGLLQRTAGLIRFFSQLFFFLF